MVADVVRELAARFPWLSSLVGERLEIDLPALLISLTMHGLLLVSLAIAGYRVHHEAGREFQSGLVVDNTVAVYSTFQDLDQTNSLPAPITAAGSFAQTLASAVTSAPSSAGAVPIAAARRRPRPAE